MTTPRGSAGYSGTPLPQKLGIKAGHRLQLIGAPADFDATLGELPAEVAVLRRRSGKADVAIYFVKRRADLEQRIDDLGKAIAPNGGLWIAWPKRSAGVPTDMTEDVVRDVALPRGLVDNKVCAIDETWSALRLVWRKELRAGL